MTDRKAARRKRVRGKRASKARRAVLAALRVIAEAHKDLHSASPCCVLRELGAMKQEARR